MKKNKLRVVPLATAAMIAVVVVQAESHRQVQPAKTKPKAVIEVKTAPARSPQTPAVTGSKQGYQLVTGVLDGFGGESESENYRMPVSSGGQPSAIGISDADTLIIEAGFVHAASIRRGDVNADRVVNVGDVVYLVNYLYRGGPEPCPVEAGDVNCDGVVNVGDIVLLVNYLYRGGPPPAC